jgi:antitoxin MazE
MKTEVQKWGNSLAVRIPKSFAAQTGIDRGSVVDLSLVEGSIVIVPEAPSYRLDELLAKVTKENIHEEVEFGPPMGKEVW